MPKFEKPRFLTDREINMIRGKSLVGKATPRELMLVFGHLDKIEMWLDQIQCDDDGNEPFGTEGWRHAAGVPEE